MIVAIAGKGGAGKTTTAAMLARQLARAGRTVVAIDADSNPNLAVALGADPDRARDAPGLPSTLVSRRLDGPALTRPAEEVLEEHALPGPDGVRVLLMGSPAHAGEGCLCSAHATVSAVLADLRERADIVTIVDFEASPEHLSRGTARHVETLLLLTEPYYRSLETVRRMAVLAADLPAVRVAAAANKVRTTDDEQAIEQFCERHGIPLLGAIPWSEALVTARAPAIPALDDDGEVGAALTRLAQRLLLAPAPDEIALAMSVDDRFFEQPGVLGPGVVR